MISRSTLHGRMFAMRDAVTNVGSELSTAQSEAITGKTVRLASDGPRVSATIQQTQAQLDRQGVWQQNSEQAVLYLDTSDQAIQSFQEIMSRARELAVQMANETYDEADRTVAAIEVGGLFEQALEVANSSVAGRYVFGGTQTDSPPFDATGAYQGSPDEPSTIVGEGIDVTTGFVGSDVFASGTDAFAVLSGLEQALLNNDSAGVASTLDDFTTVIDEMGISLAKIGGETNAALDAEELSSSLEITLSETLSLLSEADPVEAYTRVSELQTTLEAALAVVGKSSGGGLFSRM